MAISAKNRLGFEELARTVSHMLSEDFVTVSLRLSPADGRTVAWLTKVGDVTSKQYHDEYVEIHVRLPARHAGRLLREGHQLEVHSGKLPTVVSPDAWREQLPTVASLPMHLEHDKPNEEVA